MSCPSAGNCVAGGYYLSAPGSSQKYEAFLVSAVTQSTTTVLGLSASTVKYGHEQSEKISVNVTPAEAGPATGTVTIAVGKTVLCKVNLAAGHASCTLAAKKLGPGSYHLTAAYTGATYFAKSASAGKKLTVTG